jgi:hypothetical protein
MVTRIALAVLLAVAVGFAWSRHQGRKHDESRWAQIASTVVGHPVAVHCPNAFERLTSVSSEAGYVRFTAAGPPEAQTFLAPATCDGLARFAKGHKVTFENAWAVQTLAHESFHMRGVRDEAVTECYGLQWTAYVASQLGADTLHAEALARVAWAVGYDQLPDEYQSGDCRNGGRLDLRPGVAEFP